MDSTLFMASPLPTFVADADSLRILAANTAAVERYGYTMPELTALRFTDLAETGTRPRVIARRGGSSGEIVIELQRHRRKDGSIVPVHCASRESSLSARRAILFVVTELSEAMFAAGDRDVTGAEVVLIVDDERGVRAPIVRKLQGLGYVVLEAENGEHALAVMQEYHSPVHLVISDVVMPEMNGAELMGMLKSWYPGMRKLFISGYSAQYLQAMDGADQVDGIHFLAKPFSLDELALRVRDILDGG